MNAPLKRRLSAAAIAAALAAAIGAAGPAGEPASGPMTDLERILSQARTATSGGGIEPPATNPLAGGPARAGGADALPGVVVLSNGEVIPGHVYTTTQKDWQVWVGPRKRWRHIPPVVVLGIRAVVIDQKLDRQWRWKEIGSDEKIDTGRVRPVRRLEWKFHLIDDSYVTGTVKGQPLWVRRGGRTRGPFVLHERQAGKYGQGLEELVYVRQVVISRRALADALADQAAASQPKSAPATNAVTPEEGS